MPTLTKNKRKKNAYRKPATIPVLFRCSLDEASDLEALAEQDGRTRSSYCRNVLKKHIEQIKAAAQ